MKSIFHLGLLVIGVLYLLNPTMGVIELIPDNFPVIGNLDEAAAVLLILNSLQYFGIDIFSLFRKKTKEIEKD